MSFIVSQQPINEVACDCLVLAINNNNQLTTTGKAVDKFTQDALTDLIAAGKVSSKAGQYTLLQQMNGLPAKYVLILGAGSDKTRNFSQFRKLFKTVADLAKQLELNHLCSSLHELSIIDHDQNWAITDSVSQFMFQSYQFDQFKSKPEHAFPVEKITLTLDNASDKKATQALVEQRHAIAKGVNFCRDLGNTPANICTPSFLAEQAQQLAKQSSSFSLEIIDEKHAEKLGMGAFVGVSQGSSEDGKVVILNYQGGDKNTAPIALVGKGITFDTGGNSMKDRVGMKDMKFDMCGAASVLGTLQAIAELKLPINVVGVVATAENMVNGNATRPSDIVTTLSGQTVEIMNTDAEGRLVLCDAITYVQRQYQPKALIDVATLTGAVMICLGHSHSGLVSNNQALVKSLKTAAHETEDNIWQLPILEEAYANLDSVNADMMNSNLKPEAGTITAACFIEKFIENDLPWAHLDIAGTSIINGKQITASGRPVTLLSQYLINQSNDHGQD